MLVRCAFFALSAELAEAGSREEADPVSEALPLKDQPFSTTPAKADQHQIQRQTTVRKRRTWLPQQSRG